MKKIDLDENGLVNDASSTLHTGLCDRCAHQRLVPNTRGSVFSLCERSQSDSTYPRYPRLPVLSCPGHEPRDRGATRPS